MEPSCPPNFTQERIGGWGKTDDTNTATLALQLLLKKRGVLIWESGQVDRAILILIWGNFR